MSHNECTHKILQFEWNEPILSTINLSHLKLMGLFASVVESGSFAAAARKHDTSRSRVSEQISDLEAALNMRLLQRSTRQLKLTQEGQAVYEEAKKLQQIIENVECINGPETPQGRVAITMNHDIAHKHLLPVLEVFKQRYPDIQLDLRLSDEKLDLIHEQIDLAIRIGLPQDDSLIGRVLHEEQFALVSSPELIKQYGMPKTIQDLEHMPWIILGQSLSNSLTQFRQNNTLIELNLKDHYRCDSPLMVQQMICSGLGIGAVLPTTVRAELTTGKLVQIMPDLASEPLVFSLVYPSRKQVAARTRVLIDYLLEANLFQNS